MTIATAPAKPLMKRSTSMSGSDAASAMPAVQVALVASATSSQRRRGPGKPGRAANSAPNR